MRKLRRPGRLQSAAFACLLCGAAAVSSDPGAAQSATQAEGTLPGWIAAVDSALVRVETEARAGDRAAASSTLIRIYLDRVERIESYYGPAGPHRAEGLSARIVALEAEFHRLMVSDEAGTLAEGAAGLRRQLPGIVAAAEASGVPLAPEALPVTVATAADAVGSVTRPEIAAILEEVRGAQTAHARGDARGALALLERAYLERIEVLEPIVPAAAVHRVESLIHLQLRPQLARGGDSAQVQGGFNALRAELISIDGVIGEGTPFWFAAFNSLAIILREGLEAILLIGAILAYLTAMGADRKHHRRIYIGVAAGVVASFGTWVVARTLIPVTGASRELLEGVTALVAVGVLLYVSHWLFQKTYIHDWKQYLRDRVGQAVSSGSVLTMAGLAFAAVYREGFETVLFYQALLFDAPATAVLAGFVPGMIAIVGVGFAIIRMGMRLPLKKVFAFTNAILLYLAFVFLGKGLYNLQEGGVFSPLPIQWLPDSATLQQLLGLYPVAQTALAQLCLLALLALTWAIHRRRIVVAAIR